MNESEFYFILENEKKKKSNKRFYFISHAKEPRTNEKKKWINMNSNNMTNVLAKRFMMYECVWMCTDCIVYRRWFFFFRFRSFFLFLALYVLCVCMSHESSNSAIKYFVCKSDLVIVFHRRWRHKSKAENRS